MSMLSELQRRNVFRVAIAYLAAAWFLVQVVETVFPVFGFSNELIRLTIILLSIGFPLALVFSWLYELTPEGLKLERDIDRSESIARHTGKKLDRAIIIVLALAVGYFAFDKFVLSEQRTQEIADAAREEGRVEAEAGRFSKMSIAVLPFSDMSAGGDLEYLSDGIAEELLNLLARIRDLRVISRTSAFSYKNKDVKITDVGNELRVAHILEGSIRKAGERLRITVQLIDARTDEHLWSETYDRVLDDIFAVQDDIAMNVVEKLKLTLLQGVPETSHVNPEAYALFLRANHLRRQSTPESFEAAVELYKQALELEPNYTAAWNRLAVLYCTQANYGLRPTDEGYELCRDATNTALEIDPNYAPALSGLGWIAMQNDNDFSAAADYYQRALELEPTNISIIGEAAVLVQFMGRLDEAISLTEYASARDPVNPMGYGNLGMVYRYSGRLDDAIKAYRTSISLSPDRIGGYYQLGVALLRRGDPQAALDAFQKEQSEDWKVMGTALASHALGLQQDYEVALKQLQDGWGDRWPTEVAQVYAWVGDNDQAFFWLQKAYDDTGDGSWPDIRVDDLLAPLQQDPRWPEFAEKLGIPGADLDAFAFSVSLPES